MTNPNAVVLEHNRASAAGATYAWLGECLPRTLGTTTGTEEI